MKYLSYILIFTLSGINANAVSAFRQKGEDFLETAHRARETAIQKQAAILPFFSSSRTAYDRRSKYKKLNLKINNDFTSYEELLETFRKVRDQKFIPHKKTMRRASWMFPHDGCWVRAEIANKILLSSLENPLRKIYIFGNLEVKTPYSETGSVSWWYHVAPIAKAPNGIFVLDPAIDPSQPTPLIAWISKQVRNIRDASFSICTPETFGPFYACDTSDTQSLESVLKEQRDFLDWEEELLNSLGLDAKAYLNDAPPWLLSEQIF